MNKEKLSTNVFVIRQSEFRAIPGIPWVYKISSSLRNQFKVQKLLSDIASPKQGLVTADNFRFIRYSWEVGFDRIGFGFNNRQDAKQSRFRWFPVIKKGLATKWFCPSFEAVNWENDGKELMNFFKSGGKLASRPQNIENYFHPGSAYSSVSSKGIFFRWVPSGFIYEHASNAVFSDDKIWTPLRLTGLLNSKFAEYIVGLSETININIEDLLRMPFAKITETTLNEFDILIAKLIRYRISKDQTNEKFFSFVSPPQVIQNDDLKNDGNNTTEVLLNELVLGLYQITPKEKEEINKESGNHASEDIEPDIVDLNSENTEVIEDDFSEDGYFKDWISFAVGIIFERFKPGNPLAKYGSAIYHRADFSIGSLPEPTEEEFNELVGEPSQFAYIDEQGGRHVFSLQAEQALQKLVVLDGIAVFDPNHPRDLPTLVSKALELMLGQAQAQEVIQQAAGGDLRKYLEKDFFTQHHIKQYRKRPVYWPIQSFKRSYGFVLFHEKIDRNTFYALQQEPYLPTKRRAVQLRLEELGKKVLTVQGAARKPIEKEMDELRQLGEELAQFAKDLDAITRGGYEPEADWIDDGVILRMAPLWSVIPLWKSEPKKYWEELAAGKYDWSRIAMKYWPDRVKKACMKNKSYAIAHGHEEWYKGG